MRTGKAARPTRRQVLKGLTALGALAGVRTTLAALPQPVPTGPLTAATLTVSDTSAGRIGAAFAGLSYEKNSLAHPRFGPDNTDLIGLFRRLGKSLLRIGGNSVDTTHWTADGAGETADQVAPSDIDALGGFLRATGWQMLYGVNLATSTPAAAAAEVAYAVEALGASLAGIEIGNECDLYGGHYFASWTLADFERRWAQFRSAILASAPDVVLTGPAAATRIESWTIPFGEHAGRSQIALLTQHYYRGDGLSKASTAAELISRDPTLVKELEQLAAGAGKVGVPFRIAETNSFYDGGAPGVSNSYASALWVIDHLFTIAQHGSVGVNLHGGGDSDGYTPIADDNGRVLEARPEYYGLLLFTLAGRGTLLGTSLTAGALAATAYAVESAPGHTNVVVVNKDARQTLDLRLECAAPVGVATLLSMRGPALDATEGITIQGASVGVDGSFSPGSAYGLPVSGSTVTGYVAPLSAALIQLRSG